MISNTCNRTFRFSSFAVSEAMFSARTTLVPLPPLPPLTRCAAAAAAVPHSRMPLMPQIAVAPLPPLPLLLSLPCAVAAVVPLLPSCRSRCRRLPLVVVLPRWQQRRGHLHVSALARPSELCGFTVQSYHLIIASTVPWRGYTQPSSCSAATSLR